jgi:hypothetical protein
MRLTDPEWTLLVHSRRFDQKFTKINMENLMKRLLVLALLLLSMSAFAQQSYVPRYDAFTGFSYLNSPKLNLVGRGFNGEFGVNVNRWLALGGDYSVFQGHSSLFPKDLTPALQQQLAGLPLPPGFQVPFDATTSTYSAGPQFNLRHFSKVTFFVRPALGVLHEAVTARPSDPLQTLIVANLVPSGKKSDTVVFYGAGGGFDLVPAKHVGLRVGFDYVHVNLFEGFLGESRNSLRMSIGPTWRWGRNVE